MFWTLLRGALALHGLLHGLGLAAALGRVPSSFKTPISRPLGWLWLAVGLACCAAAVWLGQAPLTRGPWWLGAGALLVSQALIVSAWSDARYGTLPNLLLALGLFAGYRGVGPASFRADFARLSAAIAAEELPPRPPLGDAELAALPAPVQRYLRVTGAYGRPALRRYALRFRGRMRGSPDAAFMPFTARQQSRVARPERVFLMEARMFGLPVQAFHHYTPDGATFQVRLLGLIELVDARGPELTRAETVTVLNDMCLLAPGSLVDPALRWEAIDGARARVRFRAGANEVAAELRFDDPGELVDFVSDDRLRASPDGKSFTRQRFSTPVRDYRSFGELRLMRTGDARWHAPPPEGTFSYGEFELLDARED